jgi:GNAT superfamily N-acetyltransferase
MFARLALESDREVLRRLGRAHAAEVWPDKTWSDERFDATADKYLKSANPTVFVVEEKREVVGYAIGLIVDCSFTTSSSVFLDVIYVEPVKRGTRAAVLLVQAFKAWAERIDPDEILLASVEPNSPPYFERFVRKLGFAPAGSYYRLSGGPRENT